MIHPTIPYSIHQDTPRQDGRAGGYHLRVQRLHDMDTFELADEAARNNSLFKEGTIVGVLTDLSTWLADALASGHAVTLNGIGTFTPHIEGRVEAGPDGLKTKDLRIGDIVFAPSDQLLDRINKMAHFKRQLPVRRTEVTDAEADAFLDEHFATHDCLQRRHVEQHFALSKRRALRLIGRLVSDGRLRPAPGTTARTAAFVRG